MIEDKLPTGDLEDEQEEDGNQYTNVLNDLRKENHNQTVPYYEKKKQHELPKYEEIDIDKIIRANQKIVAFVGTSKNGTSFLLNNIAEILSTNNVNTAIEDLTQIALKQMAKIDKKTDEIYDLFYTPLALRQDRSDASKVALLDSQRIKVEMINALAGLASAKAKLEMAKQKQIAGNTGIYVNTQSGSEVGISLSNLWKNLPEE